MAEEQIVLPGSIVKKSNVLCRARWAVESVIEPRLIALVASRVRQNDEDFHIYEIPVHELMSSTNDGGQTYKTIEAVADSLMTRVVTISKDHGGFAKCAVFSYCEYAPEIGVIKARFDPAMKPHYLGLKTKFTEYRLLEFLTLPSVYSQRIFEILKSWDDQPEVTITLAELHEMLDVPDTLRANFKDFRRRVLEKAHKDITAKTSLQYAWGPIKEGKGRGKGKAVTAIRFSFGPMSKPAPEQNAGSDPRGPKGAIECELLALGVHAKTAADYAARADQAGKAGLILARLPGIIERSNGQPTAGRLRYILGAIRKEMEQQQPIEVPADPPDIEAEARKCWKEKQRLATICVPRQTGEPDGRKRCQVCLEKIPD